MAFKFEKLEVWRLSIDFAHEMILLVNRFPNEYRYSLSDQIRRAAISIPTNIAEGTGRETPKNQVNFYRIAKGSAYEVVSLLVLAKKCGLIEQASYQKHYNIANKIAAMLNGLIKTNQVTA